MIQKMGGGTAKLLWNFLELAMAGRLLRPVKGVNNVKTSRGDLILGIIIEQGNPTKTTHVKQCGRQKTLGWTGLRRPVPNGRQRRPYSLTCKYTTCYG